VTAPTRMPAIVALSLPPGGTEPPPPRRDPPPGVLSGLGVSPLFSVDVLDKIVYTFPDFPSQPLKRRIASSRLRIEPSPL